MNRLSRIHLHQLGESSERPSLGHTFDELGVLVAGKAHADEPLAVEFLSHLFEQGDAALVCLDQIVVGRQNRGDLTLDW